ncbi:lipoprotein LipL36 [Leptospira santarosai]|uniref:lipoprotein LipL36 n=1 Tax=Leptospira santarosai TaxID=28183 RepID=UPI0005186056|nr:lipoprotein LipL36 [Leptospira santarosai]
MKRNVMRFAAVAALTVALSACKKSEDNDDDTITLALLYLVDQTSGNCVTITKDDAAHAGGGAGDGKPTYTATGNTKPKAACSGSFNVVAIVNNPEAVVNSVKASYQAAKDKADTAGSNCTGASQTSADLQTAIDAVTVLKVQQSLAAIPTGAGGNNCLRQGTGWDLNILNLGTPVSVDPNPEYFGKTVYACSSEEAKKSLLSQLSINTYATISGSVATDMATNLAFKQKSSAVTASNFKWTAAAAAAGRLINVSELTAAGKSGATIAAFIRAINQNINLLLGLNGYAASVAGATTARACAKSILSNESEALQNLAASISTFNGALAGNFVPNGVNLTNDVGSVITVAQAEAVKEVLFTDLTCKYGDFDEEAAGNKTTVGTETNVKNIGTCPVTYPKI